MLKRLLLAPALVAAMALAPVACSQQEINSTLSVLRDKPAAASPRASSPTICVGGVCHTQLWWNQFALFMEALKQQQLLAFYEAVSIPYHTGTVNGTACGGDLPTCCIVSRESHGNQYAVYSGHMGAPYGDPGDPWHNASGFAQFMPGTWNGYGGYPYGAAAPLSVQYRKAAELWDHGNGAGHWAGNGC